MIRWAFLFGVMLLGIVALAGCGTPPEPVIKTVTVEKAVPIACSPTLPPRPRLLTKDQVKVAIQGAATLDDRVKIISEQLLLYLGWAPVVEAALAGCAGQTPTPTGVSP